MRKKRRFPQIAFLPFCLLAPLALLSACGGAEEKLPEKKLLSVPCTTGDGQADKQCGLEWDGRTRAGETRFILYHPDGGFRRFILSRDEKGPTLDLADGSERLSVEDDGKGMATITADPYRYWVQTAWLQKQ